MRTDIYFDSRQVLQRSGRTRPRRRVAAFPRRWTATRFAGGMVQYRRLRLGGRAWRQCLFAAAVLLATCYPFANPSVRADQAPTEFQVKAAYLFNFLKFVEWPEDAASDPHAKWVIGFVGESPIGDELAHLADGKNVLGRELQVRKIQAADNLHACNILFISESEKKRLPTILLSLRGSSVLTVADMDNFIGMGGMVQFVVDDARVRVAIDVTATGRARLKVSSKLLALAHVVTAMDRGTTN